MEFILGSLCHRGICSQGYRGKQTITKRPCTKSTAPIVCINYTGSWKNIQSNPGKNELINF